jgi:HTH-type transcriptional regulator/antitoxin HipB
MVCLPPFGSFGGKVKARSIQDVAVAVRGRRTDLGLSQADLASRIGVSRKWIYEFESGKPTAEFGLVLRVMEELGLGLDISPTADADAASSGARAVDLDAVIDRHRRR